MSQYPLYPHYHRKICLKVTLLTVVAMLVLSILFSIFYPTSVSSFYFFYSFVLKNLIIFSLLLFLVYGLFSFFFFKTLVINKEKRSFSVCRSLCGKVLYKKSYKLKNAKAIIISKNEKIKNLHQVTLEGKKIKIFLGKGTLEFAESLSRKVGYDLDCNLKNISAKKEQSKKLSKL